MVGRMRIYTFLFSFKSQPAGDGGGVGTDGSPLWQQRRSGQAKTAKEVAAAEAVDFSFLGESENAQEETALLVVQGISNRLQLGDQALERFVITQFVCHVLLLQAAAPWWPG